jgi:hypothetical protein
MESGRRIDRGRARNLGRRDDRIGETPRCSLMILECETFECCVNTSRASEPNCAQKKSRARALLGISFQLSRKTRQSFVLVEAAAIARAGGLSPSRDLDRFDMAPDRRRLSLSCVTAP